MWLPCGFRAVASEVPDKPAIGFSECELSFGEVDRKSDALAAWLLDSGLRPADRVGMLADHCPQAVLAYWATLKARGISVSLNEQLTADGLEAVLDDCRPAVIFVTHKYLRSKLGSLAGSLDNCRVVEVDGEGSEFSSLLRTRVSHPVVEGRDDDIASIVYTSGSTGAPKGVCLTHRNLWTVVRGVIEHMPILSDDSYLMVVPLHYVHGLMQLLVHQLAGATIHFSGGFLFPKLVLDRLLRTRVTGFSGVPYHFAALIERAKFLETQLPDLRWITVTGGKMPVEQIRRIRRAKPALEIHIAYGQTECAPRATALHPSKIDCKPNSVGSPIPGVDVLLLDEEGREVKRGGVGEVVISGDNVMAGYWGQPEATAAVIDDRGWLHTGDIGRFDAEGDLFLEGRKNTMIKTAGERIFADELEAILNRHSDVVEVLVVGVPDGVYGERIEAHVRVATVPDEDGQVRLIGELRRLCHTKVPFARAPKRYHIWSDFPRKANGKVDRIRLAEGSGT
ncbi:MAG: class I adenylate-forming enzyme family protein [Gemmatimonadales bacterium]